MTNDLREKFPDGTPIDEWFYHAEIPTLSSLGKQYLATDYGVLSDGKVQTEKLQKLIDDVSCSGGGVIVIPKGVFYSGALFFKKGVNLYVEEGGVLMGSDDISDYPVCQTRIEGECCNYYPALINADSLDGFIMCGKGVIDGNGLRSWKAFWNRRKWNPSCTNKDEQRARLLFLSNCNNALIAGLTLQNSQFWTSHIYKCKRVKFIGLKIVSPSQPIPSPSTDAIDIDVCSEVLVKNCYMAVNDDGVVLKGGKGPWADQSEDNGINERILVEDCEYGFCHSAITCGSESVHNKNVLVRRIKLNKIWQLMHFKLRPDTPQTYEYITVENAQGELTGSFININPWTQFFDLKGRTDKPISTVRNITVKNCNCTCEAFFNVSKSKDYNLYDFILKDIDVKTTSDYNGYDSVQNLITNNLKVEKI